jgi:8-oxo-dGTP pyrophosphatase MutT (NUDIX family)
MLRGSGVVRLHRAAVVVLVIEDHPASTFWRHRFALTRWCWELFGGLIDEDGRPIETAVRELEENDDRGTLTARVHADLRGPPGEDG